jgi:hypothetical protein
MNVFAGSANGNMVKVVAYRVRWRQSYGQSIIIVVDQFVGLRI